MVKIEVWSDFSCPFCYIGKTRLENVLSNYEDKSKVNIVYKAYQLNPNALDINPLNAYETFAKTKSVSLNEAKSMFLYTIDAAKSLGLNFDYDHMQMTSTYHAHRVAKYARTKGLEKEISTKFFSAYFELGKNLADKNTLIEIANSVGLDQDEVSKAIDSNEFKDVVDSEIKEATKFGINGVPFFIFNDKYAVSGAQSEAVFKSALDKVFSEQKELEVIGEETKNCTTDGCEI